MCSSSRSLPKAMRTGRRTERCWRTVPASAADRKRPAHTAESTPGPDATGLWVVGGGVVVVVVRLVVGALVVVGGGVHLVVGALVVV